MDVLVLRFFHSYLQEDYLQSETTYENYSFIYFSNFQIINIEWKLTKSFNLSGLGF